MHVPVHDLHFGHNRRIFAQIAENVDRASEHAHIESRIRDFRKQNYTNLNCEFLDSFRKQKVNFHLEKLTNLLSLISG